MSLSMIKAGVVAAALVTATASGAFAFAPISGSFSHNTGIKATHFVGSPTVNWGHVGDDLLVVSKFGAWYRVKVAGPDGWVKKSSVDLDYFPTPYPTPSSGPISACFTGPHGYFCIN